MSDVLNKDDVLGLAEASLTRPEDFGYWGPLDLFETWGFSGIDRHRDSSIVDRSNYEAFHKRIASKYEGDFESERMNHWAVGWVEHTYVRVLKSFEDGIVIDNITDAFKAVCSVLRDLHTYPVLDDHLYSDMELTDIINFIEDHAPDMIDQSAWNWSGSLYEAMVDLGVEICPDDDLWPSEEDMIDAAHHISLISRNHEAAWREYCKESELPLPYMFCG